MNVIIKPEKDIKEYIQYGVNTYLLPLENFSVEYSNYYSLSDIKNIRKTYPSIELFISINKNIENEDLDSLKEILIELNELNVKAVLFYDSALIKLKKDLNLNYDLVWGQTHMVTNYRSCDYYYNNGVKYALFSKELTVSEIVEIANKSKISPIVELITKPSIAFSKRKLVTNYFENIKKDREDIINVNERISGTNLIVSENKNGVFFVKDNIVNGFLILDQLLETKIDYVLLKEDFIEHDLFMKIIDRVNYYLNNNLKMSTVEKEEFLGECEELIGSNTDFFFKKTIYKVK